MKLNKYDVYRLMWYLQVWRLGKSTATHLS